MNWWFSDTVDYYWTALALLAMFCYLKLPLKGIPSTPPIYFTSVSFLFSAWISKARTCDMNEVEASANALKKKQSIWWLWDIHQKKFCIHDYFAIAQKKNAAKKLVFWHFLLWLECAKIKGEAQKYFLLFISRRSLLTVLVCSSCCQDDLFVSSPLPLRIICPSLTRR